MLIVYCFSTAGDKIKLISDNSTISYLPRDPAIKPSMSAFSGLFEFLNIS